MSETESLQSKFQLLAESSINWEYWIKPDAEMEYVSPSCFDITGYSSNEFMKKPSLITDIILNSNSYDILNHFLHEPEEESGDYQFELKIRHKNGSIKWIRHFCRPLTDSNGKYLGRRITNQDITDYKHTEILQSIQKNFAMQAGKFESFDSVLEKLLDELLRFDELNCGTAYHREGNTFKLKYYRNISDDFINANAEFHSEHIFLKKLKNRGFIEVDEKDKLPDYIPFRFIENVLSFSSIAIKLDDEFIGMISVGSQNEKQVNKKISAALKVIFNQLEPIIQNIFNTIKINTKKRELSDALNYNKTILKHSPVGVVVFNEKGKCIDVNQAAVNMVGLSLKEREDKNKFCDLIKGFDIKNTVFAQDGVDVSKKSRSLELAIPHSKTGKVLWVEAVVVPFMMNEHSHHLLFLYDITALKESYFQIEKARDEAEKASKYKDEFLANVSHEIRTPMNAILGFSELLKEKMNDVNHLKFVETIINSSNTLLSLINDILDFSKIEAGKINYEYSEVFLDKVLDEIENLFSLKAQKKNINFKLKIEKSLPKVVFSDETRIRQIIINLVNNAVKFTDHGEVSLKAYARYKEDKADIIFAVQDSGIGIYHDQKEKIFDSFIQQEGQSNRKYGGTGLGLAISRKLAIDLNGNIKVNSISGKGSIFRFTIRNVDFIFDKEQDVRFDETETYVFQEADIVIADPREENRRLIREYLADQPFHLIELDKLEGMKESINGKKIKVTFIDSRFSEEDSCDLLNEIRTTPGLEKSALIGIVDPADNPKECRHSLQKVLNKPFLKRDILNALKKFIPIKETIKKDITEKPIQKENGSLKNLILPLYLMNYIRRDLLDDYLKIKESLIIQDYQEFSKKISNLADLFNIEILKEFSNQLSEEIEIYNIEEMEYLLKEFADFLKKNKVL